MSMFFHIFLGVTLALAVLGFIAGIVVSFKHTGRQFATGPTTPARSASVRRDKPTRV